MEISLLACLNDSEWKHHPYMVQIRITDLVVDLRQLMRHSAARKADFYDRGQILGRINQYLKGFVISPQVEDDPATNRLNWSPQRIWNNEMLPEEQKRFIFTLGVAGENLMGFNLSLAALALAESGKLSNFEYCTCNCGTWFMRRKGGHNFATTACREKARKSDSRRAEKRAAKARDEYLKGKTKAEQKRILALRKKRGLA